MTTKQWNPSTDLPDLRGKIAVVTGAGTGIGFATVKLLARKGAKVYLTTRNESRAIQAKGILDEDPDIDPDNVHHLGVFLLTNRLLPLLKNASREKNADVRIVNVSSTAHISMLPGNFNFNFDSATCFRDPAAMVLFTQELQRRFDEQGVSITCISVHPGEVLTEGLLSINNFLVRTIARMAFDSAEQGAANSLFAAAATEVRENAEKYKGKFLVPIGKLEAPNPVAEDAGQVKGLWENTVIEVNQWTAEKKLSPLLAI
ncbi:hypothetical protein BHE90_015848 [Fusarium euwallaceae]|uniref:Oxidoreductase n=1 Tax=Fusarium euwallaceae TaxID=1147111 RepID=A0A430L217_9HYPO|nr:hypothetical protein BHE90_015848 [Fusarium euwallaceae]